MQIYKHISKFPASFRSRNGFCSVIFCLIVSFGVCFLVAIFTFKFIDVDFDATCCGMMFQRIPGENTGVAGGVGDGTATFPAGERLPVVLYFSPLQDLSPSCCRGAAHSLRGRDVYGV